MPNKNYIKGARKERKLVNKARKKGLIAFRSAGSHSPIDVIIIDHKKGHIRMIQCKPSNLPQSQKNRLYRAYNKLTRDYFGEFEVL